MRDITSSIQQLLDGGPQEVQAVSDVGGGQMIATVKDPDGNMIGLMQTP